MAGPFFRVGHREILYPRREGLDRKWGDAKKRRERRSWRWWFPLPYATSASPSPRFSRATLVRVSYYLTLPYGFPLNRECCSLNFIKAVSPSFESCQCCIVESHSSFPVSQRRWRAYFAFREIFPPFRAMDLLVVLLIGPIFRFSLGSTLFREAETLKNNVQGSVQGIRERIRREKGWRNFLKKQQIEEGEISGVIWANGTLTSLDGRSCFVVAWISDRWIAVRIIERYTKYFPRIYSYSEIINYYRFIFRATTVFDYLRAK